VDKGAGNELCPAGAWFDVRPRREVSSCLERPALESGQQWFADGHQGHHGGQGIAWEADDEAAVRFVYPTPVTPMRLSDLAIAVHGRVLAGRAQ